MKKYLALATSLLICVLALSGCGATYKAAGADNGYFVTTSAPMNAVGDWGWDDAIAEEADVEYDVAVPAEAPAPDIDMPSGGEADIDSVPEDTSRKIIKNASMSIETIEFDTFINELETSVGTCGGYVENSSHSGESRYNDRSAYYTVRVPADNYDAFINKVGELGNVTSFDESIDDVTLRYVDLEARLAALKAERDSFMELLEKAETVEEILKIRSYLTDVNYQIESYASQMNVLKNQVSYSTVRINIYEVRKVTEPVPETVWERISRGFGSSIESIKTGGTDFFVWIVASSPYLLVWVAIVAVIVGVVVGVSKANKKRRQKLTEEYYKKQAETNGQVDKKD